MRKTFRYLLPVVVALTLVACAKEYIETDAGRDCPTFSALIDGVHSRAVDDYWENGDKIGVSGGNASNICHITETGDTIFTVEDPDRQIYFQGSDPVRFTAYYPYNSSRNPSNGHISISTADQTNHKDFDFLWDSCEGSKAAPNVKLKFTHKMSKVSVVFKNGDNMDVSAITRCQLTDLVVEGTFDTTTGICRINEGSSKGSTTMTLSNVRENEPVTPFYIFPQALETPLKLEIFDTNGQYYVCNLTVPDNEFLAGTNYTYTITVNKTGLTVAGATLSDWIEMEDKSEASSADD